MIVSDRTLDELIERQKNRWDVHLGASNIEPTVSGSLEERISALEHIQTIQDTLVRYCYYYDSQNIELLVALFTPDCILVNPRGTYEGHVQLRRNYEFVMGNRLQSQHAPSNVLVRLGEKQDRAVLSSYVQSVMSRPGGDLVTIASMYTGLLVRSAGWQFARFIITRRIPASLSAFPEPDNGKSSGPSPTKPFSSSQL